jgi:hypothetical protein
VKQPVARGWLVRGMMWSEPLWWGWLVSRNTIFRILILSEVRDKEGKWKIHAKNPPILNSGIHAL